MNGDASPRRSVPIARAELGVLVACTAATLVLTALLVRHGIDIDAKWDLDSHARLAALSNELRILPGHFLSFWVMSVGCGFCTSPERVLALAPIVVGTLAAAKLIVTWRLLRSVAGVDSPTSTLPSPWRMPLVATILGLAFCLPWPNRYFGQFPPNQWHNTTTAVVMPLALLTSIAGVAYLRRPSGRGALLIAVGGIASVAAKPSFAMAFVPALGLALLLQRGLGWRRRAAGIAALVAVGLAILVQLWWISRSAAFEELLTTRLAAEGVHRDASWGFRFAPFELWSSRTESIPLSLLASLLFPLTVLVARWRAAIASHALRLAWLTFGCALAYYALLVETGRTARYDNFAWGAIIASYLVFAASAGVLLQRREGRGRVLDVVAWSALAAHALAGAAVLARFVLRGYYYP